MRPAASSWPLVCLLVAHAAAFEHIYWGEGWEDPAVKKQVFRALKVVSNNSEIPNEELNSAFDWLDYEEGGGAGKVVGLEGFAPQPLQTWEPRNDSVQHGYFMLYQMDNDVSDLDMPMEDMFFSVTIDVGNNPEYRSHGIDANCTLRMMLIETMPVDLGSNSDAQLIMEGGAIVYSRVLTNDVHNLQADEQVELANHSVTWGFATKADETLDCNPAVRKAPTSQLFVGIQCLKGWGLPESLCTFNLLAAPDYDDCRYYCPFVLTVRAVPRTLRRGEAVHSLIGPGEWQVFELRAGAYDLLELTLTRREYDNSTYREVLQDGFAGQVWLSKGTCVEAGVSQVEVYDYCPHGGELVTNTTADIDYWPHPLCSRDQNLTYEIDIDDASWVRRIELLDYGTVVQHQHTQPHDVPTVKGGDLDDLGYGEVQAQIAEWEAAYDAEMHYPTQLEILDTLASLHREAAQVSFGNSTWLRSWSVRSCLSSATASGLNGPPLDGVYYATVYASHAMARKDGHDRDSGGFSLSIVQQSFDRGPLTSDAPRQGCLRRGAAETFSLSSTAAEPERTSLGLARVGSFYVDDDANHASSLAVRRGVPPTATSYDVRVEWPELRASQSACDVTAAQTWHMRVGLDAGAEVDEVFFEVTATLEDAVLELGEKASGFACCGAYRYYAFPSLSEAEAALARFNVTAGEMKAIYWKYDSCPVEEQDVAGEVCTGWCILQWLRRFSGNLGRAEYVYEGTLRVPFGEGEEPDKRRAGTWYLGLQALDGAAEYTIETESISPEIHVKTGCSRLDRYCHWRESEDRALPSAAPRSGRRRADARGVHLLLSSLSCALLAFLVY